MEGFTLIWAMTMAGDRHARELCGTAGEGRTETAAAEKKKAARGLKSGNASHSGGSDATPDGGRFARLPLVRATRCRRNRETGGGPLVADRLSYAGLLPTILAIPASVTAGAGRARLSTFTPSGRYRT